MTEKKKMLIIGGGISGLRLATQIDTSMYNVTLASIEMGGLLGSHKVSEEWGDFIFDYGGHVYGEGTSFHEYIKDIAETKHHQRQAYYGEINRFPKNSLNMVPYPVQDFSNHLDNPVEVIVNQEYKWEKHHDFRQFALNMFGQKFYEQWFRPFNERVWSSSLSKMASDWVATRVKQPNKDFNKKKNWGPNNFFAYCPGTYFIDKLIKEALENGVELELSKVISINYDILEPFSKTKIIFDSYNNYLKEFDIVVNTAQIRKMFIGEFDSSEASQIKSNYVNYVGVACKPNISSRLIPEFTWMYGDVKTKIHRITHLSKYSEQLAPKNCESFLFEIPSEKEKASLSEMELNQVKLYMSIFGFNENDYSIHEFSSIGYPIPLLNTRNVIAEVKSQLILNSIFSIGRWGSHAYLNADHIFDEADNLAKILNGNYNLDNLTEYFYNTSYYS